MDRYEVTDLLAELVEKSIVSYDQAAHRYALLHTVRQYALEVLQQDGEDIEIRRRHAERYCNLALGAEEALQGPDQEQWLDRLDHEYDNIRAALGFCLSEGTQESLAKGLLAAAALWRFWDTRGHYAEGRRRLSGLLDRYPHRDKARASALDALGRLAYYHGIFEESRDAFQQSYDLFQELQARGPAIHALHGLAMAEGNCGITDQVRPRLETCLAAFRELNDVTGMARALNGLAFEALAANEPDRAEPLLSEALEIRRKLQDSQGEVVALNYLGICAARRANYPLARKCFETCIEKDRKLGYKRGLSNSLSHLAGVALGEGNVEEAKRSISEASEYALELEDLATIIATLPVWADIAGATGLDQLSAMLRSTYEANRSATGLFPPVTGTGEVTYEQLFATWPEASETGRAMHPTEAVWQALATLR